MSGGTVAGGGVPVPEEFGDSVNVSDVIAGNEVAGRGPHAHNPNVPAMIALTHRDRITGN
jgi:hypothetical protein